MGWGISIHTHMTISQRCNKWCFIAPLYKMASLYQWVVGCHWWIPLFEWSLHQLLWFLGLKIHFPGYKASHSGLPTWACCVWFTDTDFQDFWSQVKWMDYLTWLLALWHHDNVKTVSQPPPVNTMHPAPWQGKPLLTRWGLECSQRHIYLPYLSSIIASMISCWIRINWYCVFQGWYR